MDALVISIGSGGEVAGLHTDSFDLGFLGPKKVRRQSDIRFDETTQLWDIVYLDESGEHTDDNLKGFPSYEIARDTEVLWLNDCRLLGAAPMSVKGLGIAALHHPMINNRNDAP